MIRALFSEFALFIAPFVAYALFLLATRAGVLHPQSWSLRRTAWLTVAGLVLMLCGFVLLDNITGAPPDADYIPAHMDNGKFVPGRLK